MSPDIVRLALAAVFAAGYLAIALEHRIRVNKTASALVLAVACWLLAIPVNGPGETFGLLAGHVGSIAQIVFFLMGAMTIVQLVDLHGGFRVLSDFIRTRDKRGLLWTVSLLTFFTSAVLDNLTTAIIMVTLAGKLVPKKNDLLVFAGMIIIAANAGGAWSPIGDVTTTMLWIGGQVTSWNMIASLFLPSLVSLLIPLAWFSLSMKKERVGAFSSADTSVEPHSKLVFSLGVLALVMVPVFKSLTGLPPFMGMLLGLAILWLFTDLIHRKKARTHLMVPNAFSRIDFSSALFFLAILLAVAALDSSGLLAGAARWMDRTFSNKDLIVSLLGLLSAVVDNVPLTAAMMGMYDLVSFPADSKIWELTAYAVGTGGSILVIGSAAGVVTMGIAKIDFFWYLRKVAPAALLGYLGGIGTYLLIWKLFN